MSLISIIMPYYKKRNFVKNSILSVINQSHQDFEIIVIYDDSENEDYQYIKNIENLDKRIKVIKNNKNIGAGLSRNVGIQNASGDYIAFLDCDDFWEKDKLKIQLEFMKKNNYLISCTSYKIVNFNNEIVNSRNVKEVLNFKNLIYSCDIGLSTVMLKKNMLNKNYVFPNIKTKEDYVFWLKITKDNINIYGLQNELTNWRKLDDSLSSNFYQKIIDGFRVYNTYLGFNFFKSIIYLFILSINYLRKK